MREMFRLDSIIAGLGVFALAAVIGVPLFGCGGGGTAPVCIGCSAASPGAVCAGVAPCPTFRCTATVGIGSTTATYVCL